MNIVKELEEVLYHPTYMGQQDKTGVNLAVNDILNKIEELGFEIVKKDSPEKIEQDEEWVVLLNNYTFTDYLESEEDCIKEIEEARESKQWVNGNFTYRRMVGKDHE